MKMKKPATIIRNLKKVARKLMMEARKFTIKARKKFTIKVRKPLMIKARKKTSRKPMENLKKLKELHRTYPEV